MHPIRWLSRWGLTLVAVMLGALALLLLLLRLALTQVDDLAPRVERLIEARFGAWAELEHLDARLAGLDPRVEAGGLVLRTRQGDEGQPLLEVEGARLRLDTLSSLRDGMPVVEEARLDGLTLHLYQNDQGLALARAGAGAPELIPDTAFDLERLDFWVGVLLRQRAWVEELRVVLHGREAQLGLSAPRVLMTGDARRTHLEGEVFLDGDPEASLQAVLEIFPGPAGFGDFSAALQADMQLDTLIELAAVFTRTDDPLRLAESHGEARLWGRWHRGALADARLDLTAPRLALRHAEELIALENVEARGQWLRDEADDGWQAWLEGDAGTVDWAAPEEMMQAGGPALPHRWHLRRDGRGWWLNTSEFELASLAAWRDRVPLPEGLSRTIDSLAPRGRVAGLGVGQQSGEWLARAALHDVEVSPWEQAPGGGPLDAWVEVRDLAGSVRFVGADGMTLDFPEIFPAPLALSRASGEVNWAYDGPRSFVSGRELRVGWQGADVEGGFGLAVGEARGALGLDIDFRHADARQRPLVDWLPTQVLDPGLTEWLAGGAAGYVPQGRLRLHVPIGRDETQVDPRVRLDLAVEEGRLPFAPDWPALEAVDGRLRVDGKELEAQVHHAESLGVSAANGLVTLSDDDLRVRGDLTADGESLRRYLLAMPLEGIDAVSAWRGEGVNEADLDLALTLDEPGSLDLTIETQAAFTRLTQNALGLAFHDVQGPLTWHQRGEEGGLSGEVEARFLGGPLTAQFDTRHGNIALTGTSQAAALLDWGGASALGDRLTGRVPWQAEFELDEGRNRLRLTSGLDGLAIDLPAPFGKAANASRALRLDADLDSGRIDASLGDMAALRWRSLTSTSIGQGQLWLGRVPSEPSWPDAAGWHVEAYQPRLVLPAWRGVVSSLVGPANGGRGSWLQRVVLDSDCLDGGSGCVGSFAAEAVSLDGGGWRVGLDGSLMEGRLDYRPALEEPVDLALERLTLNALLPTEDPGGTGELMSELDVAPDPVALPDWVADLPNGRMRVDEVEHRGGTVGPFTAYWRAQPGRLSVDPLGLTLGEVSARGQVVWEAAGEGASLTRSRFDLEGRDLGTALERLGQPVTLRNAMTRMRSQLAWPGAPWQFALARSRGSVEVELSEGRFLNVESPSARLIGLFNLDNLVRRLRLDFSDVTGQGTAFDSVVGAATLYEGILETRGPVEVKGPATTFTLEGTVDLARRELDQRLGVTVPISRNLPLAAVMAGAPVVGGALFIADKLFGSAIDRVTRIHYRVRGPWTAPQITLEDAE